jgi:dipeptidyl aminopeptidase/acylaminoacyl peptidase
MPASDLHPVTTDGVPMLRTRRSLPILLLLALVLAQPAAVPAQDQAGPKALTLAEYGRWRTIRDAALSDDGRWISFTFSHPFADDTLYVKNRASGEEHMIPRGGRPQFSDDGHWVAYIVATGYEEAEKLREDRKPVPQQGELLDLTTGTKTAWDNVDQVAFAEGSRYLAVKKRKPREQEDFEGTDLILRHLEAGYEELLGSVNEYAFNKPGTWLAWTVDAADRDGNGLYLMDLTRETRRAADNDTLTYARLTWEEEGGALAVLKGTKPPKQQERVNRLVALTGFARGNPQRDVLFFGIKQQQAEPEESDEKVADVDLWHWADDYLQSVQMLRAERDRNFTFTSAFHLADGRFVQLTDETMRNIDLTRDGRWGIGSDERAYISDWKDAQADYYRVDVRSGERQLILEAGPGRTQGLSPDSRWLLYWKDAQFWAYDIPADRHIELTADAPVSFVNAEYDHPGAVPPYRVAGWTADGRSILLSHRYDIWRQPLDGSAPENLTGGRGTADEIAFRVVQLDPEARTVDLRRPVLLSATGQWTKKDGFFRLQRGRLTELVYEDCAYGNPSKAKDADVLLFTRQTLREFPDYWVSDLDFDDRRQVTDAIPWQEEYRWGQSVLLEYTNRDGVRLQGVLMVPDGRQPGQRLPMLVDFYEKNSQNLHVYPRVMSRDTPMFSKYLSNGYLVLLPDVHFRTRTTHSDMLECVVAAVDEAVRQGYADPDKVGLHGHSFSGQGSAYIATHSDRFAAICYGAGATNLVSDFNQLWKSSGTNQHGYDYSGQGRFGANIFDDLQLFIDQSAVYHARNMNTPLLVMHGTDDGSVEWLQGIEFYNALRYNGKNIILAAYPGEGHHLARQENQIDFQTRMEEFFDHWLKGEPAPAWMTEGVPFLEKKK